MHADAHAAPERGYVHFHMSQCTKNVDIWVCLKTQQTSYQRLKLRPPRWKLRFVLLSSPQQLYLSTRAERLEHPNSPVRGVNGWRGVVELDEPKHNESHPPRSRSYPVAISSLAEILRPLKKSS